MLAIWIYVCVYVCNTPWRPQRCVMKEDSVAVPERLAAHTCGWFRFHFQQTGCLLEKWDIATQTCLGGSLPDPQFLTFHSVRTENQEVCAQELLGSPSPVSTGLLCRDRVADSPPRELPTSSEGSADCLPFPTVLLVGPAWLETALSPAASLSAFWLQWPGLGIPKDCWSHCRWPALALRGDKPSHQGQETPHPHPNPVLNPLPSRTITLEVLGEKKFLSA